MSTYYCYVCAKKYITPVDPSGSLDPTTSTPYQLEKYVKHTAPTGVYPVNSIFSTTGWKEVREHAVAAAASGCLEIDNQGRKNLMYFAGTETGLTYRQGTFSSPCSGVILVCGEDQAKLHVFPKDFTPESRVCADCGNPVPFDHRQLIE